jgi:foldase protein PrsA
MRVTRIFSLVAVLIVAGAAASACGSGKKSVGANDVAIVGNCVISKEQFDRLLNQAKKSYANNKQKFPDAGTEQYAALRKQAMQFLVQRCQFDQASEDLGLKITEADVDKQLATIKSQYFGKGGKCDSTCEDKYKKQIEKQGLTDEQVRADVRANVVQNKIYAKVTDGVNVTEQDVEAYYKKNKQQYVQPESREVRHILVKKKALADSLEQQLKSGADFAALAKKYSQDPSSKTSGGKLTISKGRQVPEFDKAAFALAVNELSAPVKTQYGWHIIEALTKTKKASSTPLKEVKPAIKQQLLQQKKQEAMQKWVADTQKAFEKKTSFQIGFEPPATTSTAAK